MNLNSTDCPVRPEEVAEAYIMGSLTGEQAAAFEDHYVTCNCCATVLQNAADYAVAMRQAAREIENSGRTSCRTAGDHS